MQNNPWDVTEAAHVLALDQKHTPLPLWGWGFRWYLELYFRGQVEVMMTIRMPLMPHLANALLLKWADQTPGSSFLTCNTKLGFAANALSENLPLFCRGHLNCCFPCCSVFPGFPIRFAILCKFNAEIHMEPSQFFVTWGTWTQPQEPEGLLSLLESLTIAVLRASQVTSQIREF